ncbi:hypothetical protein [Streptomyces sp. NPDC026673]|uniref:hypothetical protein n=1 Tax=Streptomyces sp. NPDC026673 TaxID=3155724 RepID=UPI0033D4EA64
MDGYEGAATLEWWANGSTCLGRIGVRVEIGVVGSAWTCEARFDGPLSADEREAFGFLMDLDPVVTLRFDEGSALLADVVEADPAGCLVLTAHESPESAGSGGCGGRGAPDMAGG